MMPSIVDLRPNSATENEIQIGKTRVEIKHRHRKTSKNWTRVNQGDMQFTEAQAKFPIGHWPDPREYHEVSAFAFKAHTPHSQLGNTDKRKLAEDGLLDGLLGGILDDAACRRPQGYSNIPYSAASLWSQTSQHRAESPCLKKRG
jgi:hypothetical protein